MARKKSKSRCSKDDKDDCCPPTSLDIAWGIVLAILILIILGWFFMVLSWAFYGDSIQYNARQFASKWNGSK